MVQWIDECTMLRSNRVHYNVVDQIEICTMIHRNEMTRNNHACVFTWHCFESTSQIISESDKKQANKVITKIPPSAKTKKTKQNIQRFQQKQSSSSSKILSPSIKIILPHHRRNRRTIGLVVPSRRSDTRRRRRRQGGHR